MYQIRGALWCLCFCNCLVSYNQMLSGDWHQNLLFMAEWNFIVYIPHHVYLSIVEECLPWSYELWHDEHRIQVCLHNSVVFANSTCKSRVANFLFIFLRSFHMFFHSSQTVVCFHPHHTRATTHLCLRNTYYIFCYLFVLGPCWPGWGGTEW